MAKCEITLLPQKCGNLLCRNKSEEGAFTLLSMAARGAVVTLFLCVPCASKLRFYLEGDEG